MALTDSMSGLTTLATLAAQACQPPATHGFGSCSPLPRMCFPLSCTPPTDTAAPFLPCRPPCEHHLLRKAVLGTQLRPLPLALRSRVYENVLLKHLPQSKTDSPLSTCQLLEVGTITELESILLQACAKKSVNICQMNELKKKTT